MSVLFLTEKDKRLLQELLDDKRRSKQAPKVRPPLGHVHQAPETYIAMPPTGGIPKLSGYGTGTGTLMEGSPGSATCDIYRIDSSGDFERIGSLGKTVYNISRHKIPQDWILINRTKGGKWIALQQSHQARWIEFVVNEPAVGTGTGSGEDDGFTTSEYEVTVSGVVYHDGYEPEIPITTVYNKSLVVGYLFEGNHSDSGMAKHSPETDKYIIDQMECP